MAGDYGAMDEIHARLNKNRSQRILAVCIPLLLLSSLLQAEETQPAVRSGLFFNFGLGPGLYRFDDEADRENFNFTFGMDNRIGVRMGGHLSVFLLSHFNVTSLKTASEFSDWVFSENDVRVGLAVFIPGAVLLDSHIFFGPGLMFHSDVRAPSIYGEAGFGYSSIQSVSESEFIMGGGLFAGAGVEITPRISVGARIIWSPSAMNSWWTPSDKDYFSAMLFLYLF